jgi:hypothetical protein
MNFKIKTFSKIHKVTSLNYRNRFILFCQYVLTNNAEFGSQQYGEVYTYTLFPTYEFLCS